MSDVGYMELGYEEFCYRYKNYGIQSGYMQSIMHQLMSGKERDILHMYS